jgi:conflict system STAND superfamily ATPase
LSERAGRRSPYVGLVAYSEEDWEYFFGRGVETELVIANLTASRLTLLYGASGVGKSSVLRAGVAHRLRRAAAENLASRGAPEFALAWFNAWRDDPLAGLLRRVRESVAEATGRSVSEPAAGAAPAQALRAWSELAGGELLVILDQFEEYFLYHAAEDGSGTFAYEFPRLVNREDLRVNFLVAIREDALARLDRFKGRIPNLFDNYLRLQHLDTEAARSAIEGPLARYNALNPGQAVRIEEGLVEEVLRQTRAGQVRIGQAGVGRVEIAEAAEAAQVRVEAPYLQMVMTRIWDEEQRAGSAALRLKTFTETLGGADRIVRTHLDKELERLGPDEQDAVAEMFRYLVTPTGTKIALSVDDLASYVKHPSAQVASILEKLAASEARVLRPMPVPDQPQLIRYEIFHDVLGPAISDWRRRYAEEKAKQEIREQETKRSQEALEQEKRERERALNEAEQRRAAERTRFMRLLIGILSLGMAVTATLATTAWFQRDAAVREKANVESYAKAAEKQRAIAEEEAARAKQAEALARERYDRIKAGLTLKQAFISGGADSIAEVAGRLGLVNDAVRFGTSANPQNYKVEGRPVYDFKLFPVAGSFPGGLASIALITFKMDHETFRNTLLPAGPDRKFVASYIGWGCMRRVSVLIEYVDPDKAPQAAFFSMCEVLNW